MDIREKFERITEKTIIIPGITREYKLFHMSDVHVVASYDYEAPEVKDASVRRVPYFFVSQQDSIDKWYTLVNEANAIKPDAVLLTGDIVDFPSQKNLDILEDGLNKLAVPYVYCVGNHDWSFDYNYHTQNSLETQLPLFEKFTNGENACYSILDMGEFAIAALNNSMEQIDPIALKGLKKAVALKKPVIVTMHIPLCADNFPENTLKEDTMEYWKGYICIGENGIKPNDVSKEFIDIVTADDSPIAAIVAGHIHFAHQDKITDKINQYVCWEGNKAAYTILTVKGR